MSLLYLTLNRYIDYDQFQPVSQTNNGGGMGGKTASAVNAWSRFYPVKASQQIENGHNILVVEPLWFRLRGGMGHLSAPNIDRAIEAYKANDAPIKIVYTSETSLIKLNAAQRYEIVKNSDCITANCLFQQKQFEMLGIPTQYLCDNTPEELYYFRLPGKRYLSLRWAEYREISTHRRLRTYTKHLKVKGSSVFILEAHRYGEANHRKMR